MYLVFDCSANGRPRNYRAPHDDTAHWPNLLHISWILLNEELKPTSDKNFIIKSRSFTPSPNALRIHGLEDMDFEADGQAITKVLEEFQNAAAQAQYVFSHNLAYNDGILGAEYYRHKMKSPLIAAKKYCLMQEGTYYCKIPGKKGYKWPSLQEMHSKIFQQGYTPANHARADVIAAARCFIFLMKKGELEDLFYDDEDLN